ncbi:MAG TPA: hypothetical protein PK239_00050 [Chitinophagales bacterium]|nr:hypothetical protein [Chitinophagales bacterium]HRK25652.1 hypothetical protein [Chitinophagales bacterium]
MQLKTRVKVNQITNLSDARYFATFAEWVGFNLNPDDAHFLPVATARELIGWLYGPRIIGEFGSASADFINQTAVELGLDAIQTNLPLNHQHLHPQISTVIRQIMVTPQTTVAELQNVLQESAPYTAYFLLNFTQSGATWETLANQTKPQYLNSSLLQTLCTDYNILLHINFTPQNILPILHQTQPAGIALNSGQEIKTGLRSFDEVNALIDLLETEE